MSHFFAVGGTSDKIFLHWQQIWYKNNSQFAVQTLGGLISEPVNQYCYMWRH